MKQEYKEAERYILGIPKYMKKNRPEDTRKFYERLGCPGEGQKIIHIAGTNGKGSVCAYLSSLLSAGGYGTGMFISPHLETMRERFRAYQEMMSEEEFVWAFQEVKRALCDKAFAAYHPSFFEYLFFMGMLYFERKRTDYILLETGLGGRLDATNCIQKKEACIITEIGFDHMEYLGNTLPEIAAEKAGILRPGVPVICAKQKKEAKAVFVKKAKETGSFAVFLSEKDFQIFDIHKNSIDFSFKSRYYGYIRFTVSTSALYQVENAALALLALETLPGVKMQKEQMMSGIKNTRWEGRMEEILPDVYVDGAHNADGILAFLETVGCDGCAGKRILLFSAVKDKQYNLMAEKLKESKLFSVILLTGIEGERGLSASVLQEIFKEAPGVQTRCYEKAEEAFEELLRIKEMPDRAYIAGSLYLAGQIKSLLRRNGNAEF